MQSVYLRTLSVLVLMIHVFGLPPTNDENYSISCSRHGAFDPLAWECNCFPGFLTFNPPDNVTQCNYVQKSQMEALVRQTWLGWFGYAEFYTGNNADIAYSKLVLGCLGIVFLCFQRCAVLLVTGDGTKNVGLCGRIILVLGGIIHIVNFIWWAVYMAFYYLNTLPDGNGVPLKAW